MDTPHPPFDSFQAAWDFDTAWQAWSSGSSGKTPDLADYFPPSPPPRDFVVELVKIDLEFRWRLADRMVEADAAVAPQPMEPAVGGAEQSAPENIVALPRRPKLEDYLARFPVLGEAANLPVELIQLECRVRCRYGDRPTVQEYVSRFATHGETLREIIEAECDTINLNAKARPVGENAGRAAAREPAGGSADSSLERYRKIERLGEGAFGTVWQAEDGELGRKVALKEPRADRIRIQADIDRFLAEARVLASLDHPNIVPVYDFGRTADGSCYVVSKFIEGMDLAKYLQQQTLSFAQAAELVATVAEALQQPHNRGLVHRDIKPANILMDSRNQPHVVDFGLAIRDEDYGKQLGIGGTPAYMSPEQARPEGHLIDGRSDIFSLGVVLYQLLTGVLPFHSGDMKAVLEMIKLDEPKPPRQRNDAIPRELERICLKALSKRASDRYPSAADLAADLRQWTEAPAMGNNSAAPVRIVPKGLRSFDAGDSDFFLDLLPGSRGRDGLPEPLRFWKAVFEETDPQKTFRVGLIFGPSGCGKSSLMKAGLLPRLADHVVRVFVEASPDQTEHRLLEGLRRACGDLPREARLIDTMAAIRRGKGLPAGRKILLVLDQFEQWLHAHGRERNTELAAALRQCDGQRIQAVLLVRQDFYMDASRLFHELETPLHQGDQQNQNQFAVDLFDPPHARKVLAEFGKAHDRLPENLGQLSPLQEAFLNQAVAQLAEDGKVICVRLALFADMMKGREWVPSTLEQVGGTAGVGETFLEETFGSKHANARYRGHQKAAREVLRLLLPETGTEIKGHVHSYAELLEASGYAKRPEAFAELLKILDSEVRLITPAGEAGKEERDGANGSATPASTASPASPSSPSSSTGYQLTHDYLVPSLRAWLTRKQRETPRGRAELLLADRAATWNLNKESRHLPSIGGYLRIIRYTERRKWTEPQQRMMRRAGFVHVSRATLATLLVILLGTAAFTAREWQRIGGLTTSLLSANPDQILDIAQQLDRSPKFADAHLKPLLPSTDPTNRAKPPAAATDPQKLLHARLALVARDPAHESALLEVLLTGKFTYAIPIRERLRLLPAAQFQAVQAELTKLLSDERVDARRRFGAALALSAYVPASDPSFWKSDDLAFVTRELVSANPEYQPELRRALRPLEGRLRPELERLFSDSKATDAQRLAVANAFADFAPRETAKLADLLTVATPEQHAVLYPLVESGRTDGIVKELGRIAARLPPDDLGSVERVPFGQRRANAAATLLRMGERESALPVFLMKEDPDGLTDPEALTQFIFRCRPRGVGVEALLDCLEIVSAAPPGRYPKETRYALLLALAEFRLSEVPENRRPSVLKQVREWYANDPSSGVHGAANWLLRQWGEEAYVKQIDETPLAPSADREWFTLAVKVKPTPPVRMDFVDAAKRDSVFRERAAVSSDPWKVSFFHWEETGSKDPPTDWQTVLNSSVKAQWETENLSFHWGKGLPVQDVKNDHFAAVATRSITLSKEPYAAIVTFDDGVRVWLDDQIIYENWGFNDIKSAAVLIENKPGDHTLKIDYIQIGGGYTLRWEPVNQATLDEFQAAFRPRSFYYTFVVFPAGEYTIGSPDDEQPKREKDEVLHRVRLTRSFAILNREVTFAELIAFNRERYERYMGQVSQHPESSVSAVNWYDAVKFSRWLGTQYGLSEGDQAYADPDSPSSGPRETAAAANWAPRNWPLDPSRRGFRLPSEAEREIASRGGVRTSYGFGSDVGLLDRYGWFQENSGGRMHLPMMRRPSHRGLFDMHGNAFEWVHDWYGDYGGSRAADPLGATWGSGRVNRGGCWDFDAALCRSANRNRDDPTLRGDVLGFRLALSPVGVPAESGQDKKK